MTARPLVRAIAAAALALSAVPAMAQGWPDKPVRWVIPFPAGTSNDLFGRLVVQKMTAIIKQPIVVDNRGGAAGIIGTELVAKSAPDGYVLLQGGGQTHGGNPALYKKLPYDAIADFAPIGLMASVPMILVASPAINARTVAEIVALAKAQPGKLAYGSTGTGGNPHLAGELFKQMAGIQVTHVPYKGAAEMIRDILAGDVAFTFYPYQSTSPFVKSGKMNVVAAATEKRANFLPNTPTMIEAGFADFAIASWVALYAPAGTPRPIIDAANRALREAMSDPGLNKDLAEWGWTAQPGSPEDLGAFTRAEIARYRKLVEISGAKAE